MPVLRPISGHGSCRGLIKYLTRDGRSIAEDFLNCSRADILGVPVWRQMDETRAMHGNDQPNHGRPARTYEHFVLSPDPRDSIGLATLRELAVTWAERYFGDYECAIYYHNDNALRIPHAHVVVNNTNLETGRRLSPTLTPRFEAEIWEGLQTMATERGLRAFEPSAPSLDDGRDPLSRTVQRNYRVKAVREIAQDGRRSWVEDVRYRVDCACRLSSNAVAFEHMCGVMGLGVSRTVKGDYLFAHPGSDTWRVSGGRLGSSWTPIGIERRLATERARHVPKPEGKRLEAIERAVRELSHEGSSPMVIGTVRGAEVTARDIADMLATAQRLDLRSTKDFLDAMVHERSHGARSRIMRDMRLSIALNWLPREPAPRDGSWEARRMNEADDMSQLEQPTWMPLEESPSRIRIRER